MSEACSVAKAALHDDYIILCAAMPAGVGALITIKAPYRAISLLRPGFLLIRAISLKRKRPKGPY